MVLGAVCADRLPGNIRAPVTSASRIGRTGTRMNYPSSLAKRNTRTTGSDHPKSQRITHLQNRAATARIRPTLYGIGRRGTLTVADAQAMLRPVRTDDQTIGAERRKAPRPGRHHPLLDRALRDALLYCRRCQPGYSAQG